MSKLSFRFFQACFRFADFGDQGRQRIRLLLRLLTIAAGYGNILVLGMIGARKAKEAVVAGSAAVWADPYPFQDSFLKKTAGLRPMPLAAATRALPHIRKIIQRQP
ncbi:MAG: hypothetical protein EHM23_35340, partial [Acidobacteria bacterium]